MHISSSADVGFVHPTALLPSPAMSRYGDRNEHLALDFVPGRRVLDEPALADRSLGEPFVGSNSINLGGSGAAARAPMACPTWDQKPWSPPPSFPDHTHSGHLGCRRVDSRSAWSSYYCCGLSSATVENLKLPPFLIYIYICIYYI